jgi:signal transduction histidine kinase/CheY-like chemotaxis protein
VAFKTAYPIIENNLPNVFLYNTQIDNPLHYPVRHMGILPVLRATNKTPLGLVVLYRQKEPFTRQDFHLFESITGYITTFLRRNTKFKVDWEEFSPAVNFQSHYLRAVNKLKTSKQFFYSIIHDIRTPLNAMIGFLQLLLKSEKDPQKRDFIQSALNSGDMIIGLINDLLDIAKLEEGKLTIEKLYFTPISLFEDVAKLFFLSAKNKGVEVIPFFDPQIPFAIYSDNHRLQQVLNNLLSNAVKFTPEGKQIFFRMEYRPDDKELFCSVRDTGIGIPEEVQERLFKPYEQASAETSKKFGGTGLGLYISKQLVEILGGELNFKSKVGEGTEFFFTIPVGDVDEVPPTFDKSVFQIMKLGIMVEGLDESIRELLDFYLSRIGVRYRTFTSLEEPMENCQGVVFSANFFKEHQKEIEEKAKNKKVIIISKEDKVDIDSPLKPVIITQPLLPKRLFTLSKEGAIIQRRKRPKKRAQVLVAEDEVVSQKLLKHVFEQLDALPTIVGDGKEALKYFKKHKDELDIIFLDQNMPRMGGIDTARKIREENQEIPIYILSGENAENLREQFGDLKIDGILTKPIKLQALEAILGNL